MTTEEKIKKNNTILNESWVLPNDLILKITNTTKKEALMANSEPRLNSVEKGVKVSIKPMMSNGIELNVQRCGFSFKNKQEMINTQANEQ